MASDEFATRHLQPHILGQIRTTVAPQTNQLDALIPLCPRLHHIGRVIAAGVVHHNQLNISITLLQNRLDGHAGPCALAKGRHQHTDQGAMHRCCRLGHLHIARPGRQGRIAQNQRRHLPRLQKSIEPRHLRLRPIPQGIRLVQMQLRPLARLPSCNGFIQHSHCFTHTPNPQHQGRQQRWRRRMHVLQ